jgi:hypothetical protein
LLMQFPEREMPRLVDAVLYKILTLLTLQNNVGTYVTLKKLRPGTKVFEGIQSSCLLSPGAEPLPLKGVTRPWYLEPHMRPVFKSCIRLATLRECVKR